MTINTDTKPAEVSVPKPHAHVHTTTLSIGIQPCPEFAENLGYAELAFSSTASSTKPAPYLAARSSHQSACTCNWSAAVSKRGGR
jgi:hypothetical protein